MHTLSKKKSNIDYSLHVEGKNDTIRYIDVVIMNLSQRQLKDIFLFQIIAFYEANFIIIYIRKKGQAYLKHKFIWGHSLAPNIWSPGLIIKFSSFKNEFLLWDYIQFFSSRVTCRIKLYLSIKMIQRIFQNGYRL